MNTCSDTSSVKMMSLLPPPIPALLYVALGLSLASKKRAWLPCWSQSTSLGTGNLFPRIS